MNVEKASLKVLVATDIGASIEDRMEAEQKTAVELEGGFKALVAAASKVPNDLCAKVDKELSEGSEIKDGMTSLEVAELIKKYLTRAGNFLAHLADVAKQRSIHQFARAEGLKDAMEAVVKMRAAEIAKIDGYNKMLEKVESSEDEITPSLPPSPDTSAATPAATRPRTAAEIARVQRGSIVDRRAAEDAAREQHGSVADRRAAAEKQTTFSGKPENIKKKPQKAVRKKAVRKQR